MAKKQTENKKKESVKKAETKVLTASKEQAKLTAKEPLKKVTTKKVEKIETKPEPKKVVVKEVKKIAVKPQPKRVAAKEVKKVEMKEEPEKAVKKKPAVSKSIPKKPTAAAAKKAYYDAMPLKDCIANMQKMNVQYHYEDYAQLLMDEKDVKQLMKNIYEGNGLQNLTLDYKVDGYDQDLVKVTLDKVKASMDITPADFKALKKEIETSMDFKMTEDPENNAEEYLKAFHLCERISMLAKRKRMKSLLEMEDLLKCSISEFTKHFMDIAYALLPSWQYEDVTFYEDFMYSYVSLFDELYLLYEQRVQLDCADLYILHGDRGRGNANYDYLLRENQIKDYIYYRFAHVYEHIDLDMAKSIAQSSLQVVDDRYVYYPNIIEILNK